MYDEFETFISDIDGRKAESTVEKRRRELAEFSKWLNTEGIDSLADVDRGTIFEYVEYLIAEGYAPNSIMNGRYATVSAAINYCYREHLIEDNPIARIERKEIKEAVERSRSFREKKSERGEKDHLTREQVYELAEEHVPEPTDRNELLIKLMFWTGCRVSEVTGVRREDERTGREEVVGGIRIGTDGTLDGRRSDVDPQKPVIEVFSPKTQTSESGGWRYVSYPRQEINPLLRDWVNHGRLRYKSADETNLLFIGPKGPIRANRAGKIVNTAAENMGIQGVKRVAKNGNEYKRVTSHLLRHSHAMHYRNKERTSVDDISGHLGHSSKQITEDFYVDDTEERIVDTFGE